MKPEALGGGCRRELESRWRVELTPTKTGHAGSRCRHRQEFQLIWFVGHHSGGGDGDEEWVPVTGKICGVGDRVSRVTSDHRRDVKM